MDSSYSASGVLMKYFLAVIVFLSITSFASNDRSNREAIRLRIREHLEEVQSCYKTALIQNQTLDGKLVIHWVVDDQGAVKEVSMLEGKSTIKDTGMQSCITDMFKTWSFPPAPKGQVVSIDYPFVFKKGQ